MIIKQQQLNQSCRYTLNIKYMETLILIRFVLFTSWHLNIARTQDFMYLIPQWSPISNTMCLKLNAQAKMPMVCFYCTLLNLTLKICHPKKIFLLANYVGDQDSYSLLFYKSLWIIRCIILIIYIFYYIWLKIIKNLIYIETN